MMATRKEETFSKERIKAEMNEAKWGSVGLGFVAGILALIAISFTVGATSPYVSQEVGGIAFLL